MPTNRSIQMGGIWAAGAADVPSEPIAETTYAKSDLTSADIQAGWPFSEIVESSKHNEVMRRITSMLTLVESCGILPWCSETVYGVGSYVLATTNHAYKSLQANNQANDPATSPLFWANMDPSVYAPPGMVSHFAQTTAPFGWLTCDGSAVSRTAYAALFTAIGTTYGDGDGAATFNLPDLRGEFIRGFDGGRGVDSGRAFASSQTAKTPDHYHGTGDFRNEKNDDWWGIVRRWSGTFLGRWVAGEDGRKLTDTITGGGVGDTRYTGTTNQIFTDASEVRPRNIALLPCVKY